MSSVCPPSVSRRQRGAHIIFQAQRTYICLTEGSFTNCAEKTACSFDGPECFLLWAFVCLHSSLEGHTRNNIRWSRSVVCWSKRAPLSVSVHHHAGVVSARNMLTCQLAPSLADLFLQNLKYDLQLASRGARIAPRGRWLLEMVHTWWKPRWSFKKLVVFSQLNATEHVNEEKNSGFVPDKYPFAVGNMPSVCC